MAVDRPAIRKRAAERCEYCRAPERVAGYGFMVDHVLPRAKGGTDHPSNLALACWCCNSFKSDRTEGSDPLDGKLVPLFHPRRQSWADHFRWMKGCERIEGITPTGRATVVCLRMNEHPDRTEARRLWHAAGWLP